MLYINHLHCRLQCAYARSSPREFCDLFNEIGHSILIVGFVYCVLRLPVRLASVCGTAALPVRLASVCGTAALPVRLASVCDTAALPVRLASVCGTAALPVRATVADFMYSSIIIMTAG